MIFNIRCKGITLQDKSHDYIEKKLTALKRYYQQNDVDSYQTNVSIEQNTAKDGAEVYVEVRIAVGKKVFIAEEKASTVEEGIDLIHDKLKTQLQRYKEKMQDHHAE
ncbi:MAG: ribosome-associated translation inhibitor RaiA [Candidatus Abawacabacteria bacterium]|nr:ribosome-associated translation inhibitor RaiA [Candidatus Abawacabacteria bacterium]